MNNINSKYCYIGVLLTTLLLIVYIGINASLALGLKTDVRLQGLVYKTKTPMPELKKQIYDFMTSDSIYYNEYSKNFNNRKISFDKDSTALFCELIIEIDNGDDNRYIYNIGLIPGEDNLKNQVEIMDINHFNVNDINALELKKANDLFEKKFLDKLNLEYPIKQQPSITWLLTVGAVKHMLNGFEYDKSIFE